MFEDYDIKNIPIDVFSLALKMDIVLHSYSEVSESQRALLIAASKDGFSYFSKNKFHIYYNDKIFPKSRIRFTIMHEIGHVVLKHSCSNDANESEADFFARNALAPLPLLIFLKIENKNEIVEKFDVSNACAENILRSLITRMDYKNYDLFDYEQELINLFKEQLIQIS